MAAKAATRAPKLSDPLFGRLRELRAILQGLRDMASALETRAETFADPVACARELDSLVEEGLPVFVLSYERADRLLGEAHQLLAADGQLYAGAGDTVARIQLAWDRIVADWFRIVERRAAGCSRELSRLVSSLDDAIFECGLLTIPERFPEHLKYLPIGGVLSLRDAYADELPRAEDRRKLLAYLENYPGFAQGVIDIPNERILKASPKAWRRNWSWIATVLIALGGFAVVGLACRFGSRAGSNGWPFKASTSETDLRAYAFLLLGALAHVTVNLLKQDRTASTRPIILSDWLLRIHVKETSFFLSALSLWIGPFALAFLFHEQADWKIAFFVGYSYDSFIDLFLKRFDDLATAGAKAARSALESPAKGG